MRKVELRMNEKYKYDIIKKLVETNGNKKRASIKLNLSIRQINRLINGYKEFGKEFFVHGNRGRKPSHALTEDFKNKIEELYTTKYFDCTYTAFKEYLEMRENINISIDEARIILRDRYIFSPRTHKSTKKKFKEKLQKELEISKAINKKALKDKLVLSEDAHPRQPRCQYFGEEIQMDACIHLWFGNSKAALHAAIDDSTGQVLGMFFDKQETLNGYYKITEQILSKYGIPYLIKTDKRTVFEYKKKASSKVEEDTFTQYAYACNQLGIHIETSSVPEFKPRIERLFQTLQQRLPQEFRLNNITTINEANKFLENYIIQYNNKFALHINNTKSVFEKQPSKEKINLTLAILAERIVDSGHSIKYENKYYRFINKNGKSIYFNKGTKCIVIKALDNKLYATIDDSIFALEEISETQAKSKNFYEIIDENINRTIYIPRMIHPWKGKSFNEFVKKQKHRLDENVA
jgi:transposase